IGTPPISEERPELAVPTWTVWYWKVPVLDSVPTIRRSPVPRACGTWRNRSASGDVVIAEAVGAPAKAIPREIVQVNWIGKAVVPLGVTDRWAWMISPGTYEDLSNDMPRNTPIAWRIDALADEVRLVVPVRTPVPVKSSTS